MTIKNLISVLAEDSIISILQNRNTVGEINLKTKQKTFDIHIEEEQILNSEIIKIEAEYENNFIVEIE